MEKLYIIKIGGRVIDIPDELDAFLKDFAKIQGKKILVHGGGKWVSEMSRQLGLEVKMIEGRRITDEDTLKVVKMMLPGIANKTIVATLQKHGCNALGLTGADGNLIRARKRPVINNLDYGFVGDVEKVDAEGINSILNSGFIPVFTAMTHDGKGQMLNTNADTIASVLATGLSELFETDLIFCFEKKGVLKDIEDEYSLIPKITLHAYQEIKKEGVIHTGMIPKIDNAFDALNQGVSRVHICNYNDIGKLSDSTAMIGTVIQLN